VVKESTSDNNPLNASASAFAGVTSKLDNVAANAAPNTARRVVRGRSVSGWGFDTARVAMRARRTGAARATANEWTRTNDVMCRWK
tara:strand:- start:19358 stop:19615 length:258 start_codon:yes stop_codon:yes gene_type:complete